MGTTRADSKRRIVIPGIRPGGPFPIQRQTDGRFLPVGLEPADAPPKMTREQCLEVMSKNPLNLRLTWEQVRQLTREPCSFSTPTY